MFQFDAGGALVRTALPLPKRSGKVREVYDLGEHFLIVSSDRISAFDHVLPSGIPDKGRVLTATSEFWFKRLQRVDHHWTGRGLPEGLLPGFIDPAPLIGRSMLVRKADVIPFECVVRGYLEGTALQDYRRTGSVCGIPLPAGLVQCDALPEPIFTPATKAASGHDENVSFESMAAALGQPLAERLRTQSLDLYRQAAEYAAGRGILIADTKFEFGWCDGQLMLIDEVLTPDSSRFWPAAGYAPGGPQLSFDKQFVREWLLNSDWDRNSPPPPLPPDVILRTREKYLEAYRLLTGHNVPGVYFEPGDADPANA